MAGKSYLKDAQYHLDKIKHFYDHAGANGYSQARHHYDSLSACYAKSAQIQSGEAVAIKAWYDDAGKLLAIMKRREEGKPDEEQSAE
jgi:hypothetical protein